MKMSKKSLGKWVSAGVLAGLVLSTWTQGSQAAAPAAKAPLKVGFSVSLSGDFSSDGQAVLRGYRLWASEVNSHGGILGRKVQLKFYDDASSTTQVAVNYTKLITVDKVALTFGPYSSLLTIPACAVAARYGYAFPAPAGGGPAVFQRHFTNFVFVQPAPVANNLLSFGQWLSSLPKSKRPKKVAYVAQDDPFAKPQVDIVRSYLSHRGFRSVYYTVLPAEATDFQPAALAAIHSKADVVILGTPGAEPSIALAKAFIQQHFNPKAFVATSGPDQGSTFANAIGKRNTEGIMVPSDWWPGARTYQNSHFVSTYLKRYGGTAADISTDTPEAYSAGQVMTQAINKIRSVSNAGLIRALHRYRFNTVEGPMKFARYGQPQGQRFLVQWRNGKTIPVYPFKFAVKKPEYPKPHWH